MKKAFVILTALCLFVGPAGISASAADSGVDPAGIVSAETASGYAYTVNGDSFDFFDYTRSISITGGTLKNGRDISYYGLNDAGNLAVVYFNVEANEGKGVVAANDAMVYVTYANGEITEVERGIGATGLFSFDMSLADPSMAGMMKVFNASLGSFLQAYAAELGAYSAISSGGTDPGAISYVGGTEQHLLLMDDNYITNFAQSSSETFMANEWGIYSGYQVVDGVDYNTFCFFGDQDDVYYFGYAKTETGFQILNMKGNVYRIDDRTQYINLKPVHMNRTTDNASQYITKMGSCLMAAQGRTSLNLDSLRLQPFCQFSKGRFITAIYAYTANASGILNYENGAFTGSISDENGNAEPLTVQMNCKYFTVTSQSSGVFTVARNYCGYGSLYNARPIANNTCYNYWWFWYPFCWWF